MRHETPFEQWFLELDSHVQKHVAIELPGMLRVTVTRTDVHNDWACGRDPEDTGMAILKGTHRSEPSERCARARDFNERSYRGRLMPPDNA